MARGLGIADRVTFAGELHDELPDYYRAADVLLQPSDWEAFGLVQIEAMATAKPVIITAVPGARVVSDDGEHGLHVRPGDAADLARALRAIVEMQPSRREAMGHAGRARVLDRYTWGRSVDALEQTLSRAVSGD
jgi:glycosyltransferase involved in cell wall biosynthesis